MKYHNFLHTYCDAYHARYIDYIRSVTSTVHIFNGTIVYWCDKKQSETSKIMSNTETRSISTGVLDQSCIRDFFISIGCPIGPPSKLYEDNQAKIKRVLSDIIKTQSRPLGVLITALRELHLIKTFDMVDTRSNMQLSDLKSKPHGGKSIINIMSHSIGYRLCPPSVLVHYKLLRLEQLHGPSHINFDKNKKSCIKMTITSYARNCTTKPRADQI